MCVCGCAWSTKSFVNQLVSACQSADANRFSHTATTTLTTIVFKKRPKSEWSSDWYHIAHTHTGWGGGWHIHFFCFGFILLPTDSMDVWRIRKIDPLKNWSDRRPLRSINSTKNKRFLHRRKWLDNSCKRCVIRQSSIDIYTFHLFDVVAFCGVVSLDQGQSSQLFPIWHSCRFHLFLWGSFFHGSMRMTKNTLKQNETKLNRKNLLLNPILWFLSPQSEWKKNAADTPQSKLSVYRP